MKIKAFLLSAVAAIVTGLVSCDNAELKYDDVTGPGRLFLNEAVGTAKSVSFVIPDDVGGRFSVLSPVGLLPLAVAGVDIAALVRGAQEMEKATAEGVAFKENPAAVYAAVRNILYDGG